MVPAGEITGAHRAALADALEPGDTIIDGGNSYYHDDIRRAAALAGEGHPLRRLRHERRRLRARARLLPDDRRAEDAVVARLEPIFATLAPGVERRAAHARTRGRPRARGAGLAALRAGRRRPLREDGAQRHRVRADGRLRRGPQHPAPRRRRRRRPRDQDAETAPLDHPEFYQYDLDVAAIAEVWRRGSVVASWLLDLTAAALHESPGARRLRGSRLRLRRGPLDVDRRDRRGRAGAACSPPRSTRASPPAARRTSPNKVLSAMRKQFGGHHEKPA